MYNLRSARIGLLGGRTTMYPSREMIERVAYGIWEARGRGDEGQEPNWLDAESHLTIVQNYEVYRSFWLSGEEGPRILFGNGDGETRVCRYCHKGEPEVTFRTEAHSVPYFLGNR